jgi:hypothetical protein
LVKLGCDRAVLNGERYVGAAAGVHPRGMNARGTVLAFVRKKPDRQVRIFE